MAEPKRNWYRPLFVDKFEHYLFAGISEDLPLWKKLSLMMSNSTIGTTWDVMLIVASLIASVFYVIETYQDTKWSVIQWLHNADTVFTSLFTIDFALGIATSSNTVAYVFNIRTILDLATFIPYYVQLAVQNLHLKLSIFRFLKIYRLIRIMRLFKSMRGLSGPTRQMIILFVTLFCFILIGAGIFQLFENDLKQLMNYQCNNVGPDFLPSCDPVLPFQPDCDCIKLGCHTFYNPYDPEGQPSGVDCGSISYFDSVYFVVVTVGTLGYGDFVPTTDPSRALVLCLMLFSFIVIPMQVQAVATALASVSVYRRQYKRGSEDEQHVIICGNINNRDKVERILTEFYHPSRSLTRDGEIKILLLSPMEPKEDIRDLLMSFTDRVTYLVGSALSLDDLRKAGARYAKAVLILCNPAVNEDDAALDDAANILRSLNFINYNNTIECYAQIIRRTDGEILRDAKVDVVLCMDEFRTTMQARNAVCPGISTLIENLFHTFGDEMDASEIIAKQEEQENSSGIHSNNSVNDSSGITNGVGSNQKTGGKESTINWIADYVRGADFEVYYVSLSFKYKSSMGFLWPLMAEGIYLEFGAMLVGVCCKSAMSMILNPSHLETSVYPSLPDFYREHDTGVLICESFAIAAFIAQSLESDEVIDRIVSKMVTAEESCHVRQTKISDRDGPPESSSPSPAGGTTDITNKSPVHGNIKFSRDIVRRVRAASEKSRENAGSPLLGGGMAGFRQASLSRLSPTSLRETLTRSNSVLSEIPPMRSALLNFKKFDEQFAEQGIEHASKLVWHVPDGNVNDDIGTSFTGSADVGQGGQVLDMTDAAARKARRIKRRRLRAMASAYPVHENDAYYNSDDSSSDEDDVGWVGSDSVRTPSRADPFSISAAGGSGSGISSSPHRSRSLSNSKMPTSSSKVTGTDRLFGHASREIENASHLADHVIVFGTMKNFRSFVSELRRSLISSSAYRPVVFVGENCPDDWKAITSSRDDVYWLKGDMLNSQDFNRANVRDACSVVLLANRENLTVIDQDNLDTGALFAYLALEKHMPKTVFFTIELIFESNISSLNSSVVPRLLLEAARTKEREAAAQAALSLLSSRQSSRKSSGQGLDSENLVNASGKGAYFLDRVSSALSGKSYMDLSNHNNENKLYERVSSALSGKSFMDTSNHNNNNNNNNDSSKTPRVGGTNNNQSFRSNNARSNSIRVLSARQGDADPPDMHPPTHHAAYHHTPHNPTHDSRDQRRPSDHRRPSHLASHLPHLPTHGDDKETPHVKSLFSMQATHHTLPIFASGSAFVPTAMDTILSNCFFDPMAPLMCERLLCGQKHKTMLQLDLPPSFVGRQFVDVFRAFLSKNLYILALRRGSSVRDKSLLPYVCTCPKYSTELRKDDRLFVFCSPMELDFAMQKFDGFTLIKKRKNLDVISSVDAKDGNKEKDIECFLKTSIKPLEVFTGAKTVDITRKWMNIQKPIFNPYLGTRGGPARSLRVAEKNS